MQAAIRAIRDTCLSCSICAQYLRERPRQPMKSHDIPSRPWSKLNADLFHLNRSNYLDSLVDNYSDFIELEPLRNTLASTVIRAMKRNFTRSGVPDECITDNGPQFDSNEYSSFARGYGFTVLGSSPYYSRRNGKAESAVKSAKSILKKSRYEDPYLALLAYQNTPQQGLDSSPAHRLMSSMRRLEDIIPTATSQLAPQTVPSHVVLKNVSERIRRSKMHYNKRARRTHSKSLLKGKRSISNPGPQICLNHRFTERWSESPRHDLV